VCQQNYCIFQRPLPLLGAPRAGFLLLGAPGQLLTTTIHEEAEQQLATLAGLDVVNRYASRSQAAGAIDDLIADGVNVVVGSSSDLLTPVQNAALRHPETNFLVFNGFQPGPTVGSYAGRMYQVMYLVGALAGRVSATGRVGVVAPVPIPDTVRDINSFALGVVAENPAAAVVVDWTHSWVDDVAEVRAAQELVQEVGADVVLALTGTSGPLSAAIQSTHPGGEEVFSIGYGVPTLCDDVGPHCLTVAYWNVAPVLERVIREMERGEWNPTQLSWEAMKNDRSSSTVFYTEISHLVGGRDRVHVGTMVDDLTASTEFAPFLPFVGPIVDNTGNDRLAASELPTDQSLKRMCWFVEGVQQRVEGGGSPAELEPATIPVACQGDR
jgi:basic membrane protein A